jgi:hypothetical protein
MRRVSLVGILIGGICDIATSYIALFPVLIVEAIYLRVTVPNVDQTKALIEAMHSNLVLRTSMIVMGCLCSILGGYVAARIAKRAETLNGALSASIGVGLSILNLATGRSHDPYWLSLSLIVLGPVLGAIGGVLWARQSRRRTDASLAGTAIPG